MGLFPKKSRLTRKSWRENKIKEYSLFQKKKARKSAKLSRFLFWFLLIGFVGICVYLLLFSNFLDIESILIYGNLEIPSEEIAGKIEKSMEGKIFKIFPSRNYFFINRGKIDEVLRNNFSHLEASAIEKKFPQKLIVNVIERKPEIVWCSAGVCYLTAEDGLIYDGTQNGETEMRNSNNLVVVDDRARTVDIGKTKINPDFIRFIEAANKMLRDNLEIPAQDSFHTPEMASGEVSVKTSEGWVIRLSSSLSIEEEEKIIRTLFEKELNPDARKKLEYLDLRVRNKAYYKMR